MHEPCTDNEIFVGNISVITMDHQIRELKSHNIQYRIGETAYDIHGNILAQDYMLPLFIIGEDSQKRYNDMMMQELTKIRMS